MVRALLLTVSLTAACYSPPEPDCGFFCGPGSACPADYHCAHDGVCHRDGAPATLSCGIDAAVDAPRPPGFDAADNNRPQVLSTSPVSNGVNVALTMPITVTFDEPVLNVTTATFVALIGSTAYMGTVTPASQSVYTFAPINSWPLGTQVQVELYSTITDLSGNGLLPFYFSFTTTSVGP
ncbi:MAG TPA: Ig-like domain-containing protein [Kofleriaceae bacterium]|nr:Ig-like domain-containing protein [Kofleriaceae bacterium]